ncbi:hypothetical protein B0E33_20655 [Roseibium algicola]|uniref:Uncharacterized protein n=1 Tax=Roseibium algicola TaxID=2857014 RepID=A0ABM6I5Q2_9HYPH|nr:hypothetical protein [Roseibium aggregatum]AQQ05679.1 hypothetical protein B0E33_20655 [Roseibium aggregatum]
MENAMADPLEAQTRGDGVRTWQIFMTTGEKIEFSGGWNMSAGSYIPATFLSDVETFHRTGQKPNYPTNVHYLFPKSNKDSTIAASLSVDIGQILAVVMLPH